MTAEELQALHAELWAFRAEMDANTAWKTPPVLDALRFAVTEAGEAMDAWLRVHGGYARNHEKQPDVYGELADCAMMLMTALGPEWKHDGTCETEYPCLDIAIDSLVEWIAPAPWAYRCGESWTPFAAGGMRDIALTPGMDLPTELRQRMERIRTKHASYTIHADGRLMREGDNGR